MPPLLLLLLLVLLPPPDHCKVVIAMVPAVPRQHQWPPPGPNSKARIKVVPARPEQHPNRKRYRSEWSCRARVASPHRTRTASPGSELFLPDLNCGPRRTRTASSIIYRLQWFPVGPEQPAQYQDHSSHCRTSKPGSESKSVVVPAGPKQQALDESGACQARAASARSEWLSLDPSMKPRIRVVLAGPQVQARDRGGPRRARTAMPNSKNR